MARREAAVSRKTSPSQTWHLNRIARSRQATAGGGEQPAVLDKKPIFPKERRAAHHCGAWPQRVEQGILFDARRRRRCRYGDHSCSPFERSTARIFAGDCSVAIYGVSVNQ
jgi:hypothetical protein